MTNIFFNLQCGKDVIKIYQDVKINAEKFAWHINILYICLIKHRGEMKKEFYFNEDIASGQEITTNETRHGISTVVFLFPEVTNFIGFLIQFFPSVIISTEIQNKGQQTTCLIKNVFALISLSSKDLQNTVNKVFKQMLKTVNT